jgi:hypothetical protein
MEVSMTMEYLIRFGISLFDLGVFWHYLITFRKRKYIPEPAGACALILLAAVWAQIDVERNHYFNLMVLVAVLMLVTLFFEGTAGSRVASVAMFIGIGIVMEPVGMLLLYALRYTAGESPIYLYYLVMALCAFIRGNVIFLLCRLMRRKELNLLRLPKEIVAVLVLVFAASVVNCCFITILSMETDSVKSKLMCISIIGSIVLTYYFMLYMIERISFHVKKQQEDKLYIEEMRYKEIYYAEAEKRNAYVHKLKHDMENRILGFYHLVAAGDTGTLLEQIAELGRELGQTDEDSYSSNPSVDTVLRFKIGAARAEGIKADMQIHIPKKMQIEYGDIGVLYGNLLDNAIEACRKLPEPERFISIENKYVSGRLLLVITNSKENRNTGHLKTTKKDTYTHGYGIASVRRVVEKYNGVVQFKDNGTTFEVSVMLYNIGAVADEKSDAQ